ncbi:MAG: nucleoside triphosphate pyrophosphohydrolase [Steroidobacter sp.]
MNNNLQRLLDIMATLRDPAKGCPWDKEQTFATIAPYTLEEAYEVADAIARNDMNALKDELGDLLFQVVFHSQMAAEQGAFNFDDVAGAICDKMQRRHPHVFGDEQIASATAQTIAWEEHKRRERGDGGHSSVLDNIPLALPALTRAAKLGKRAATIGFEWPDVQGALDKMSEELREVQQAVSNHAAEDELTDELGDVLFCVVNVCRHLHIDPEAALRSVNNKFERRFRHVEARMKENHQQPKQTPLAVMDSYWDEAKEMERQNSKD